jgi:hypothetical protein
MEFSLANQRFSITKNHSNGLITNAGTVFLPLIVQQVDRAAKVPKHGCLTTDWASFF